MNSVCSCKNTDHTIEICIGEIKRLNKERDGFFNLMREKCEHLNEPLCVIPVSIYPEPGAILCRVNQCPLLKVE